MTMPGTIALYRLAHARTGDKGDRSNISVIAYDERDFEHLLAHVTEDAVRALFRHRQPAAVTRYVVPSLHAMNFVLDGVLIGAGDGRYLALTGVLNLAAYAAVLPLVTSLELLLGAFTLVYLGARALTLGMRARGTGWIVTGATT